MPHQTARKTAQASGRSNSAPQHLATAAEIAVLRAAGLGTVMLVTAHASKFHKLEGGVRQIRNRFQQYKAKSMMIGTGNAEIVTAPNGLPAFQFTATSMGFKPADPTGAMVNQNEHTVFYLGYPEDGGSNQLLGPVPGEATARSLSVGFATAAQRLRFWNNDGTALGTFAGSDSNANVLTQAVWTLDGTNGRVARRAGAVAWADASSTIGLTSPYFQFGMGLSALTGHTGKVHILGVLDKSVAKAENGVLLAAVNTLLSTWAGA